MRPASGTIALAVILAVILAARPAEAGPTTVLVDLASSPDEVSRAMDARLISELTAAGFAASTTVEAPDVRASFVVREGRPVLYLELADGRTLVLRADDVPASEAPSVLALRAVERLRAVLAAPEPPPPKPPPPKPPQPAPTPPPAPSRHTLFNRWHIAAGATLSIDRGAASVAPTVALGRGVGAGFFLRASFFGPSTPTSVKAPQGSASILALGARVDGGWAWPLRAGTSVGANVGVGVMHHRLSAEATSGFVASDTAQTGALIGLDGFVGQHLAGPVHLVGSAGAALVLPALGVRIAGERVAERGLPDVRVGLGVVVEL